MAAIAVAISATLALAGDPAGHYSVVGSNPGSKSRYSGTFTVERTGGTFHVTWDIGSQTFVGTGIGSDKGLAVAYRSGSQTGLAGRRRRSLDPPVNRRPRGILDLGDSEP